MDTYGFHERICPICGKKFYASMEWAYVHIFKDQTLYCCTWTCLRKAQAKYQKRAVRRRYF